MDSQLPNPYQTFPDAPGPLPSRADSGTEDAVVAPFRPLAVVVGAAADNAATLAFNFIYVMLLLFRIGAVADAQNQVQEALESLPHLLTLYVMGGAMSILGGFVAGTMARRNEILHGTLAGILSALLGHWMNGSPTSVPTSHVVAIMEALGTPLTIGSAILGGFLARQRGVHVGSL